MFLDDDGADMLSHVIVSTYELKEWMVLKDRFGSCVRYIIPPIPDSGLPDLNDEGFLRGANALTRDILDNENVMKYVNDEDCGIILLENPPFAETTNIEFQKRNEGKNASSWKQGFVVEKMKKEVKGVASNEMGNAFIWSAFKYFLRQPTDSYIVFLPVKYWKAQHLIVMYNFCERIMAKAVIHVGKRKHTYQINYTMGFYVCRLYFRGINTDDPELEIAKYILPVRPGRADRRKTIIKKGAVCFSYRVA
ncbi:MAG: hypothetical protein ACI32Q_02380 [Intestinibaculum porci]|uniref:hypothetical protein n=1 Tax=Intestinibaculum porci TaxID=2487118 RepID=UPI003F0EE7DD